MIALYSLFSEILTEQGKELIINSLNNLKQGNKWKKLIVDSGKQFIDSEKKAGAFIEELSEILSKKSLKELAKELREDSGYGIVEKALSFLVRLMSKYEIPHDRAIVYSQGLLTVIIENIKDRIPEKYDRVFQEDWKKCDLLNSEQMIEKIETVSKQLKDFKESGLNILSSDQIDQYLFEKYTPKYFGVSFFEVDDPQFCKELSKHKNDERLYIKCKCKEEAVYCTINELWHQKEERPVFVIKNEESWNALRKIENSGNIYIADFWADEIIAIPNNTNIFLMQENLPLFTKNYIELRPRTRRTLLSCLEYAGLSYQEGAKLIDETHGLFTLMKRRLINGVYDKNPEWVDRIPNIIVKTCLLLCNWKENEGDRLIIEELSGYSYEKFVNEITKYSKGDDPFVVITTHYGERDFSLASVEDSWTYYDVSVDEEIWKKYIELFSYVMTQNEKLLSYVSTLERIEMEMKGEKLDWSSSIRKGMVHALMTKAYYNNDEKCQKIVNERVKTIIQAVSDVQQWRYISNYFSELCELAPNIILNRFLKEFDEPTGLIQLFTDKNDDYLFGTHYYINILWGLEQLLVQREYASSAFEIVLKIDDMNIQYKSNNPRELIRTVLCAWGNFSAFDSADKKIHAAKKMFELDRNAWDILNSVLPGNQQTVVGSLSKPLYREYVNNGKVSAEDFNKLINAYFSLLIKNIFFDYDRWSNLFDSVNQLSDECNMILINKLLSSLKMMDDLKKIKIKDSLREIVYKHRFFKTASWAMGEERIKQYEELLKKITIDTPEYEYAHYYNYNEMNYPLCHPNSYDDNDYLSKNSDIVNKKIKDKTKEFREKNLDLSLLAYCCASRENVDGNIQSYLGWYLALYWDEYSFDSNVFAVLLKVQSSGHFACDYFRALGDKAKGHLHEALDIAQSLHCSTSIIVSLYQSEAQITDAIPEIDKATADIKELFWSQYQYGLFKDAEWALNECKKYGTCGSYIRLLFFLNDNRHFDSEVLYNHIRTIPSLPTNENDRIDRYFLTSLLKLVQDDCLANEEKRLKLAKIEILFSSQIDWNDMKCVEFEVKSRPDFFVEILSIIYKTDDGSVSALAENNKKYWKYYYRLYDKMKFCPAEENGYVDEELLNKWIRKFDELLKDNKQCNIRGMVLGHLFSYSPAGRDGFFPCEAVRVVIEESGDSKLINEYQIAICNNRGAYYGSEGEEELNLSEKYKQNADYLTIEYPKTASIFYGLADKYKKESVEERRKAENDF